MEYPKLTKMKYRAYLVEQLKLLSDMADEPSMTVTRDTVINVIKICFEINRELYKLDNEIQ